MEEYAKTLIDLVPPVVAVGAGYALARWGGLSPAPLQTILRYALLPAVLFALLVDRVPLETFGIVAGLGAAMTALGFFAVKAAQKKLSHNPHPCAAVPNVACFALPFLALSWQTIGLGIACALFVGVAVASAALEQKLPDLAREPWPYAAAAAMGLRAADVMPPEPLSLQMGQSVQEAGLLTGIGGPLVMAGLTLMFLLLGASLHPFQGLKDSSAWATVGIRLACGVLVAAVAIALLPMSRGVMEALVIVALAPPTARALRLSGSAAQSDRSEAAAANVGAVVSLAAMCALLIVNW